MTGLKKRRNLLLLLCCFAFTWVNAAIPYNQWWIKANQFYNQKTYDSAAFYYEKIAAQQPENSEVYYNLGNTYYRLNKVGLSILNYKRVLRIEPNNRNAKENLILAQSRMTKKTALHKDVFFVNWWKSFTSPTHSGLWAALSYVLFLSFVVFLFLNVWRKYKIHSGIYYTLAFLFLLIMTGAVVSAQKRTTHNEAVVTQSDAVFRTDLKKGKPELLPEGTIVKWNEARNEYVFIQLPDGREGWVNSGALEKI